MNCPVCDHGVSIHWAHARDVEYHSVPDVFEYRKCTSCASVFLLDPPVHRLSEIYPPNYYSFADDSNAGFVQRVKGALDRRWFARALRGVKGSDLSVLDVGGGAGQQLDMVRLSDPRVKRTTIVDLDAKAASRALSAGHEFVQSTIEAAPVTGQFDVILMLNIIEHVADPRALLRRAKSLLSPNGIILVKTPNVDSLDARLFRQSNWGGLHCPRHFVLFNAVSFMVSCAREKLYTRQPSYTQGAPFWAVSVLAGLERRGLARISKERPAWRHPLYAPLSAAFAAFDFARRVNPFWRSTSQMTFTLTHPPAHVLETAKRLQAANLLPPAK